MVRLVVVIPCNSQLPRIRFVGESCRPKNQQAWRNSYHVSLIYCRETWPPETVVFYQPCLGGHS